MAGVNSRFAQVSEAEILQIQDEAVPENTKKATKYGLKVLKVREDSKVLKSVWGFILLTISLTDLSIKSYFLMVSSLILLRSLRVYIPKQLFFSILVNSGFRNIHLATSWLGKYLATIHLDFKE